VRRRQLPDMFRVGQFKFMIGEEREHRGVMVAPAD
jgi:hypothetical protein